MSEQIEGARRVLVDLAGPEVSDPFIREQITHAAAALEHAAGRWSQVLPDLVADVRALEELLGIQPAVLAEAVPGVPDLAGAEEYHRELRAWLVDEIMVATDATECSPAVRAYLSDSVERLR
ncbi:hypothetical protein [Candidatus Poriferisocius sp.]|uniref:hypothetical protein n=1 Tax=Candidatus Poriferisocius sp. TaxID=3101276 RepID=UPI003B02AD8D